METTEEINDLYHLKNKIADLMISHHYNDNIEKKTNTDMVMETLRNMWGALDEYRDKHIK